MKLTEEIKQEIARFTEKPVTVNAAGMNGRAGTQSPQSDMTHNSNYETDYITSETNFNTKGENNTMTENTNFNNWHDLQNVKMIVYCNRMTSKAGGEYFATSTSVAGKDYKTKEYKRAYIPVSFTRECVVNLYEGMNEVFIEHAFITADTNKDKGIKIVITAVYDVRKITPKEKKTEA